MNINDRIIHYIVLLLPWKGFRAYARCIRALTRAQAHNAGQHIRHITINKIDSNTKIIYINYSKWLWEWCCWLVTVDDGRRMVCISRGRSLRSLKNRRWLAWNWLPQYFAAFLFWHLRHGAVFSCQTVQLLRAFLVFTTARLGNRPRAILIRTPFIIHMNLLIPISSVVSVAIDITLLAVLSNVNYDIIITYTSTINSRLNYLNTIHTIIRGWTDDKGIGERNELENRMDIIIMYI